MFSLTVSCSFQGFHDEKLVILTFHAFVVDIQPQKKWWGLESQLDLPHMLFIEKKLMLAPPLRVKGHSLSSAHSLYHC